MSRDRIVAIRMSEEDERNLEALMDAYRDDPEMNRSRAIRTLLYTWRHGRELPTPRRRRNR